MKPDGPDIGVKIVSPEKRVKGVEDLNRFLDKTLGSEPSVHTKEMYRQFSLMSAEDFLNFITRIHGILNSEKIKERKIDERSLYVGVDFKAEGLSVEYYRTPEKAYIKERFPYYFNCVKEIVDAKQPRYEDIVSRSVYNLLNYSHLFDDGNGRLSRIAYLTLNPQTKGKLPDIALNNKEVFSYHIKLNLEIFKRLLSKRSLPLVFDQDGAPRGTYMGYTGFGPDHNQLGFIAAYDLMNTDQKEKVVQRLNNPTYKDPFFDEAYEITDDDLTYEQIQKFGSSKEKVRREFYDSVIDASINDLPENKFIGEELENILIPKK